MWAFYSSGTSTIYDRIIIMIGAEQLELQHAGGADLGPLASAQIDLDTDDPADPARSRPRQHLAFARQPRLYRRPPSAGSHRCQRCTRFSRGAPLAAIIETAEGHLSQGQRTFVTAAYPLVDAAPVTVTLASANGCRTVCPGATLLASRSPARRPCTPRQDLSLPGTNAGRRELDPCAGRAG